MHKVFWHFHFFYFFLFPYPLIPDYIRTTADRMTFPTSLFFYLPVPVTLHAQLQLSSWQLNTSTTTTRAQELAHTISWQGVIADAAQVRLPCSGTIDHAPPHRYTVTQVELQRSSLSNKIKKYYSRWYGLQRALTTSYS